MKVWTNGNLIDGPVQITSLNFSLHYGSPSAWEGVRSYTQQDGTTKIWKLREHVVRLFDSAKIVGLTIPYTIEQVMKACEETVAANGNGDLYLRPIAYSTQDAESVKPLPSATNLDIYAFPIDGLFANRKREIKMAISNLVRGYPQYDMQAKTASNYNFIQRAKTLIDMTGVDDVFVLDNQGYIVEATVANIYVFKGDVAFTPPNRGSILPGITRKCMAEILLNPQLMFTKHRRAPLVIEKDITKADLYTADCVVLVGTYVECVNVTHIDGRQIGSPETHTYFRILSEEYDRQVRGK